MRFIEAYKTGWNLLWQRKWIWIILFFSNLVLSSFIAWPFEAYLTKVSGYSQSIGEHLGRFDFTFLGDLSNNYGAGFWVLLNQAKYIIISFLIVSIFLNGGVIGSFKVNQSDYRSSFFHDCGHYFWRLFRLALLFLVLYVCVTTLAIKLFEISIGGYSPFNWTSDGSLIWSFRIVILGLVVFLVGLMLIHDYTKVILVTSDETKILKAIKESAAYLRSNLGTAVLLYVMHFLVFAILFLIYRYLRSVLPISGLSSVLIFFLVSELFILSRIGLKIFNLTSIFALLGIRYKSDDLIK